MNAQLHDVPPFDPSADEEDFLANVAGDEDYWDYLDELEFEISGCREWDNASVGGAA